MTPDLLELGKRAVACKRWRWLPGMLTLPFRESGPNSPVCHPAWRVIYEGGCGPFANPDNNDAPPDLTDAATLGCLLALVREAWADPRIHVVPYNPLTEPPKCVVTGKTEAEALVAALEAAP